MRLFRLFLLTLPLPLFLGYCWTVALIQAELASGSQNETSIGQMIQLVVIPLTFMFEIFYCYLIMDSVGRPNQSGLKIKLFMVGFIQTAGTFWGLFVLGGAQQNAVWSLLSGGVGAAGFSLIILILFPREKTASGQNPR